MNIKEKIENSAIKLDYWIDKNGWAGYDPYDIKELPLVRKITKWGNENLIAEILREGLFEFFLIFPVFSRKLLLVKPQINAKAMGLFAQSFLDLYRITKDRKYFDKANESIEWLDKNYSKNYPGKGWGYPFIWEAKKTIPRNTPNGIVTTAVGSAYFAMYKQTGKKEYLDTCKDICVFLTHLPIDYINNDQLCFSYTPIFINHVHNLNLFVAEFLIRIGKETNNNEWVNLGIRAANYTIANQDEDGSFDYDGPPEKLRNFKDHYHTCFVLQQLYSIWKLTKEEKYFSSLEKCYNHYIHNFFDDNKIPKFTPERKYRIDIHSNAASLLCLSELSEHFPEGLDIARNVAEWTIDTLQDKDGYFYYGIFKNRITGKPFVSKIPFMRWGQAWMLRGLSVLLQKI